MRWRNASRRFEVVECVTVGTVAACSSLACDFCVVVREVCEALRRDTPRFWGFAQTFYVHVAFLPARPKRGVSQALLRRRYEEKKCPFYVISTHGDLRTGLLNQKEIATANDRHDESCMFTSLCSICNLL
jgi:hypothetical protein